MQYRTLLVANVPRVQCDVHGVTQVSVPWSDPGSRFTALFEALVIDWLGEASFSAVARQLSLSWDQVAGIQERAVRRGLARRERQRPRCIGVDETSFRKRAEYITVVNDLDRKRVLWVGDDRKKQTLAAFYKELGEEGCAGLEAVAMDMWAKDIGHRHANTCLMRTDGSSSTSSTLHSILAEQLTKCDAQRIENS
jgi:transposase